MLPKSKGPAVVSGEGLQTKTITKMEDSKLSPGWQRVSAWTDLIEVIADRREQLTARLADVEALDVDQEVRIFRRVCDALSDLLKARRAT